jgi:ABC-type glutathione transport system ATPase component
MAHFMLSPHGRRVRTRGADGRRSIPPSVELESVVRVFGHGAGATRELDGVSLRLAPGPFTAVMGPSGSGKTTMFVVRGGAGPPKRRQRPCGRDRP